MKVKFILLLHTVILTAHFSAKAQSNFQLPPNCSLIAISKQAIINKPTLLIENSLLQQMLPMQNVSNNLPSKQDYLTKSHHQKTIAWIMLGGGAALTATGFAIASSNSITNSSHSDAAANVIAVAGLASMAGSIPFFISAAHNKKMAASVSVSASQVPAICMFNNNAKFQPAATLKIAL